jgi:DNA-binding NtrC family response regulator
MTGFTKLAIEALLQHDWPGNVRELRNVIDRAILLETADKIGCSSLIFNPEQHIEASTGPATSTVADLSLEKAEKELIRRALQHAGWQKTRAATLLGITRATLYAKISQYDIKVSIPNEPALAEAS